MTGVKRGNAGRRGEGAGTVGGGARAPEKKNSIEGGEQREEGAVRKTQG